MENKSVSTVSKSVSAEVKSESTAAKRGAASVSSSNGDGLALPKGNLKLIAIGFAVVIIGFICMIGGGAEGSAFNPAIYSARYITIGPVISVIGFFFIIYAILRNPKTKSTEVATVGEKSAEVEVKD